MGPIATAMGEIYQFTLEGRIPEDPKKKIEYPHESKNDSGVDDQSAAEKRSRGERG